ncbi:hypothetical protein [Isorropodon fossajaponicum symbiont]|uniref:hypothetical protein n=1 Tax=Isorropodon fossajaponicum symbiont TaxID=883811 RepID=UPI0019159F60|nr:hypothetical protein [Isorropodon fossajaponicum symbiont]
MKTLGKPNSDGAELILWLNQGDKKYVQKLISTLPVEDLWMLDSNPDESSIRDKLYENFGVTETINFLSKFYPSVSFKKSKEEIQTKLQLDPEAKEYDSSDVMPILFKKIKKEFKQSQIKK